MTSTAAASSTWPRNSIKPTGTTSIVKSASFTQNEINRVSCNTFITEDPKDEHNISHIKDDNKLDPERLRKVRLNFKTFEYTSSDLRLHKLSSDLFLLVYIPYVHYRVAS